MKILDCTTFLNEVELLQVRLEEHWDYVDKFIITEAAHTYARNPKSFNFLDSTEQFKPYMEKIHYIPFNLSHIFFGSDTRANENIQQYYVFLRHPEYLRDYDYMLWTNLDKIID